MKKILVVLLVGIMIFSTLMLSFSGCALTDKTHKIGEDVINSYENISEEAGEVYDDLKEKKEKAEETIEDLKNAADEIGEAADAVKEITD